MDPHSVSGPLARGLRALGWGVGVGAAAGLGTLAYSAGFEVRDFVVRRVEVAVLPPGHRPLKVLHISDIHMTPSQRLKQAWLASLADLGPDLVVNTGDNLSHRDSVPVVMSALGDLLDLPGVFVLGSNDYLGPVLKNPLRYFLPNGGFKKIQGPPLPWRSLRDGFARRGWVDLTNTRGELKVGDSVLSFAGRRRPTSSVRRPRRRGRPGGPAGRPPDRRQPCAVPAGPRRLHRRRVRRDLRRTHPWRAAADPGVGALVTNCDIEPARSAACTITTPGRPGGTPGCTSRPDAAPRRTRRTASAATPRRLWRP